MPEVPNDGNRTTPSDLDFDRRRMLLSSGSLLALAATGAGTAVAQETKPATAVPAAAPSAAGKPNILVIWGDDIGITNIWAYSATA